MLSIIFLKNETRPMINYGELESNSGESQAEKLCLPWWMSLIMLGILPLYLAFIIWQDVNDYFRRDEKNDK